MNKSGADPWLWPALLVLATILTLGTAGWGPLYNETDGQYAGAARVMAEGGSWLIPENNGIPRLVKPPLLVWLMAASMKVFGTTEWAARLPGSLALIALCAVTYLMGTRLGGPWRGFMAGGILLTSLGTFTLGRIVMPEPVFCAGIALALYGLMRGVEEETPRMRWTLAFWGFAALASFSKGWHGLLYPLLVAGLAAWWYPPAGRAVRTMVFSGPGALLFLAVNLPWYLEMERRFPGYLQNLFWAEQWGHVIGSDAPANSYQNVPRLQFLGLHLAWFFPWSVVAGAALWGKRWTRKSFSGFASALVAAWVVVVLGVVLLAGQRQDYYAMAMWPAAALGAAWALDGKVGRAGVALLCGLLVAALAGLMLMAGNLGGPETIPVAERVTAWTTLTGLGPEVWVGLVCIGLAALGVALICSAAGWWVARKQGSRAIFWGVLAAAVAIALGAAAGFARVSTVFSLAALAPELRPGETVVFEGGIDTGSSLLFYTRQPVLLVGQDPLDDFVVRTTGQGRDRFLTEEDLAARWKSPEPMVLIIERNRLEDWRHRLGPEVYLGASSGTQVLVRNFP